MTRPPVPPGGVEIVGVDVVPHLFSKEMRWHDPPEPELGALVRLFVRNPSAADSDEKGAVLPRARFNGRKPRDLVQFGQWAWHDTPDNREGELMERILSPGRLDVWTFNAIRRAWGPGKTLALQTDTLSRAHPRGVRQTHSVALDTPPVVLSKVLFHDTDGDGYVDACTAHVANASAKAVRIEAVRVWSPGDGQAIHNLAPGAFATRIARTPADGVIPPGERGVLEARLGRLPQARGVVEVRVREAGGALRSCWAHLRFKDDAFAIGSGWLEYPTEKGVNPLFHEPFLKLLKRMHVDTTHVGEMAGYTDQTGPDGLYTRYPLRLMSGFPDVARYSRPEWARRIHGVDILGEPQIDKFPYEAHAVLRRYDRAAYPTTVTLSEEQGFRYFAGLADHPHYDAYRVSAPSADDWGRYERWEGGPIRWGAPLETIGEMTRTLRTLSRPAPIAVWSQNVHDNWEVFDGRLHFAPTPDELRVQAYQALANGVSGLYWYSLQAWSLLKFRNRIPETLRIGREIRLLEEIYNRADAFRHERRAVGRRPRWDLNVLVAPDAALLFAIDLAYHPDRTEKVFRFGGPRALTAEYPLPAYLRRPREVFRVDADGVHAVHHAATPRGVRVSDTVDRVGIYVAAKRPGLRAALASRHARLLAEEARYGPDPATDEAAFTALLHALGYSRVEEVGQKAKEDKAKGR